MTALPYIDILPSFDAVRVVNIRVTTENHILIVCEPVRPNVACPKCACLSQKITPNAYVLFMTCPALVGQWSFFFRVDAYGVRIRSVSVNILLNSFLVYLSIRPADMPCSSGHIFVCVLAYLFEQEVQVMYRRWWEQREREAQQMDNAAEREQRLEELGERWYTGERIMKELKRWHVMKTEFLGKEFLSVPPPPQDLREVLKALNIPLPAKAIHLRQTSSGTLV